MKNIHLIKTDKPSRLIIYSTLLNEYRLLDEPIEDWKHKRHIYITNDEEIKDYNWYISSDGKLLQFTGRNVLGDKFIAPKVIITTDQDLIADGVQAIDDEFLEWFVKNSSCERVEIRYTVDFNSKAVIIIPKEEPKQETIEEVELAILFHNTYERLAPSFGYETRVDTKSLDITTPNGKLMIAVCKEIIKWQTERMYSEEDLKSAFFNGGNMKSIEEFNYWFEQFKK